MLSVFLAFVMCLAVAVISPLRFIVGINEIPSVLGMTLYLSQLSPIAALVYVLSNQASAKYRPPGAWGIDFLGSVLAAGSLIVTSYHVWRAYPVASLEQLLAFPAEIIALYAMAVYSIYDVSINQATSWRDVFGALGRVVATALLLGTLAVLAILMFGLDFKKVREQLPAGIPSGLPGLTSGPTCSSIAVPVVEKEPYGYDGNGEYNLTATFQWKCRAR